MIETKCFELCKKYDAPCSNYKCRYWINSANEFNCSMILSNRGPQTLEKVAESMGMSKTSVRLVEEKALSKVKHMLKLMDIDSSLIFGK